MFLDFDGTLVPIAPTPDTVVVTPPLLRLLGALADAFPGRVAVVSGRSLDQLDHFLGPIARRIALGGSHGLERRSATGRISAPARPAALDCATDALHGFAAAHPGAIVEDKSLGVALHYRLAPALEDAAMAEAARVAGALDLALQPGKMMVELKPRGADKGNAIRALLDDPTMAGSVPIMLGDDLTDEPGFAAVAAAGGWGVLVGPERETGARYRLDDPAAVSRWLAHAVEARA